ncbi:beta-carotene 15,15'-monooxygenase [Streptococcus azizii]|uniref:Beta-carotene 15,15'-monooxygenase n=1 Tax=Streptococcus azizii TaxID=1579424 RepID=A0AB36JT53_9STRE|nr:MULTISPECIES: TraX family protein [Streptococcus]MBF0775661.1 beta-carotene 15,15'-monooxygenase [Streptococcus sp. 19428wD3_AN2]ONK28575.1 beta-carotene 15,15'-monooxygenase [Streptococcus azizii]ONK29270.1 beta-carotene 15,15'-monooxygenase [Streptococcus azizii]ONK30260.1 beta-carotene 15,15'-monooxygenase [Streptococcus azizii]TFU84208.1 beta-carotene 15,15'-monooxygenase [Streptococcus sp. AN2]
MKQFNAFQLKLGMALLMVLDHIHVIPGFISPMMVGIFHALTRCVGVWFAFMAVEGFRYTHSRWHYLRRLFGFSVLMLLGNSLFNVLLASKEVSISNNIFMTLAGGVLVLQLAWGDGQQLIPHKGVRIVVTVLVGILASLLTEGGIPMIPFMVLTYIFYEKEGLRNISYLALSIALFVMSFQAYPSWQETLGMLLYNSDWLFITVLPFMYLYNGERGLQTAGAKYFFYLFYPLHLWLIAVLAYLL